MMGLKQKIEVFLDAQMADMVKMLLVRFMRRLGQEQMGLFFEGER